MIMVYELLPLPIVSYLGLGESLKLDLNTAARTNKLFFL